MNIVVATFYHFFDFPHYKEMRTPLLVRLKALDVKGSLLIAAEGINATLAGTREAIDECLSYLKTDITHEAFEHKESFTDAMPFARTKVRLKKETISLGEPVALQQTGHYVEPAEWNALIADPDTIILDTRNGYEVHLGTFKNARDPGTRSFKELPAYARRELANAKQKKIATFCTGGIRCEKFTAWMLAEGFENVYHLKGGILKYLEVIPKSESTWEGECYVFDERVAVGHGLVPTSTASACPACGHTLRPEDRAQASYRPDESCPFCISAHPRPDFAAAKL